ncbi:MAG: hypothetical protein AB7P69_07490 [Candidatus Binatia bacterium]
MVSIVNNLERQINEARSKIVKLFIDQCTRGQQTRSLNDTHAAGCGQFIGESAYLLTQRGFHGTAAALRVLAETEDAAARDLVPKLVYYFKNRKDLELKNLTNPDLGEVHRKCEVDESNVIKISEMLYSLCLVRPGLGTETEDLIKKLAQQLQDGLKQDLQGWGYFLDEPKNSSASLLPTAYAVFGLSHARYRVDQQVKFLLDKLKARHLHNNTPVIESTDITTDVACLYAVTFLQQPGNANEVKKAATDILQRVWEKLESVMTEDFEQNVEYWRERETFYVRVPWQLYLLALLARLSFREFCSDAPQARLHAILNAIEREGFRYPHSGRMLSSRTNAVVYEVLGKIGQELQSRQQGFAVYFLADRVRTALGSRLVLWSLRCLATVFIGYVIYTWITEQPSVKDLAPDIIATILLASFALAKR